MNISEQVALLREHSLFSSLDLARLTRLAKHTQTLNTYNEQLLFRQGDVADRFFIVVSGHIKLFTLGPDQEEKVIEIIGPGHSFGEAIMFLDHQVYPVNAQAVQDSQLLHIPNQHYLALLREHPKSCFKLLAKLSKNLHQRLNEIESLTQQSTTARVSGYLLNQLPANTSRNIAVQLQAPKQAIASQLGMKPETFSRVLAALAKQQAITVNGAEIVVLDHELLLQKSGRFQAHPQQREVEA